MGRKTDGAESAKQRGQLATLKKVFHYIGKYWFFLIFTNFNYISSDFMCQYKLLFGSLYFICMFCIYTHFYP